MSRVLHTSLTRVTQLVHPIITNAVFGFTLSFNNVSGENFLHGKITYVEETILTRKFPNSQPPNSSVSQVGRVV